MKGSWTPDRELSPADEELSDDDEEVDSNNDGGSLQSERTDKDEEAYDSESPASTDTSTEFKMLEIASWQKKAHKSPLLQPQRHWVAQWGGTFQL